MKYRALGRTGLRISEITFGGGAVGGLFVYGDDSIRSAAIKRIVSSGINWIDTAPIYANGQSEEAIGHFLNEIPASDRPHISTKVRLNREAGDFRGQVQASVRDSLQRLGVEKVDLLQVHGGIAFDPQTVPSSLSVEEILGPNGVAEAFESVRDEGLAAHIGLNANGETEAIRQVIESDRFETAQVLYNLLNPSAGRAVPGSWAADDYDRLIDSCDEHGVGVLAFRVLAAGIIGTDIRHGRENPVGIKGDLDRDELRMQAVVPLLADQVQSRGEIGIRYVLDNPKVSSALVGIGDLYQLEEAIHASQIQPLDIVLTDQIHELADRNFGLS